MYLWKYYIDSINIPNVLFNEQLKKLLKEELKFENNMFLNVTSKFLPNVSTFLLFWDQTITNTNEIIEFEISELKELFNIWIKQNNNQNCRLKEAQIYSILKHYHNDLIIENKKFIINIKSSMWDKIQEIKNSLDDFKIYILQETDEDVIKCQTIYKIYNYYIKSNKNDYLISKRYYEMYIKYYLSEYIEDDGFIKEIWFLQ